MPQKQIVIDIETRPFAWDFVSHLAPEELMVSVPTIDMIDARREEIASDKRVTKEETRQAKLDEWIANFPAAQEEEKKKWMSRAQLDPRLSHVCYIGALEDGEYSGIQISDAEEERDALRYFFPIIESMSNLIIGHNVVGFDFPYMSKRSLFLGDGPLLWREKGKRWTRPNIADTMEEWKEFASYGNAICPAGLDDISRVFGWDIKPVPPISSYQITEGECHGDARDFWRWNMDDRRAYSEHDCQITNQLAKKLRII